MRRVNRQGLLDRLNAIARLVFAGAYSAWPARPACPGGMPAPSLAHSHQCWRQPALSAKCQAEHVAYPPRVLFAHGRLRNYTPPPLLLTRTADSVNNPTPYLFLTSPLIFSDTPSIHQCACGLDRLRPLRGRNILKRAQPSASARRNSLLAVHGIRPMRAAHSSVVSQPAGGWPSSCCASTKRAAQSVRLKGDRSDEPAVDLSDLVEGVCAVIV